MRCGPDSRLLSASGPRGNVRDTTNTLIVNQTDFTKIFSTGSVEHTLVQDSRSHTKHYDLDTGNVLRNPSGVTPNPALPPMSISDPDYVYAGPQNYIRSQTQDGELDNQAIYVFDTLKFNDHWELNGGVRYENNEGSTTTVSFATPAVGGQPTAAPPAENSEKLFSYAPDWSTSRSKAAASTLPTAIRRRRRRRR